MRLLSSGALWWLLLGLIIVFLYLLKLKRKRVVVPSVLLWKRALEEVEANASFKKLRRSLLLLLQLLALVALVFALARPLVVTRALASGSTVIIIIDSTASMRARDEDSGSRLDRAKQLAREMIEGLNGSDRAAVIESSSRVTVRSPLTSDRGALASAIADIQETDAPGSLTDALRLAEQIAKSERDVSVVIIGDGGSTIAPEIQPPLEVSRRGVLSPREASVRFVRVGRRSDNIGIIALNSRQLSDSARREMFASIANFGDRGRSLAVELKIEGKLVDSRTIDLGANERRALVFDSLPQEGGIAELTLDVDDDLASDNVAFAFLPGARRVRVGVAAENQFLLEALLVNPDIDASRVSAAAASNRPEFDCFVIEGASAIEARPLLIINPPDAAGLWRTTGQRERPEITSVERSHPVNSFLSYGDLHIENIAPREVAAWLKPIVSAGNDPVIWAGDDGHRRMVVIAFDLAQSDLPLKVEFPILLSNSLSWLAGRNAASSNRTIRAGQTAMLHTSAPNAAITTPGGYTTEVTARDGLAVFADTLRAGRYDVKGEAPFAVSLLSEAESNTAPRDAIKTRAGDVSGQPETFNSEREAWRWIVLFALAVLMIEWWAYHRRIA